MAYSVRDRGYGPPPMYGMTTGVKWLLIINSVLFVLYFLTVNSSFGRPFLILSLVPRSVLSSFAIWQLFTYLFLHSPFGFGHILINMLTLWMFGTPLESVWGTRRFLYYYFFCGIGAGVFVVILNALFGDMNSRTIGASGAIYGLLLAFGMLFPRVRILFLFLFPIEARWMVIILGAIVFLSAAAGAGGGVSNYAHLGGLVVGYLWLRFGWGDRILSRRRTRFDPLGAMDRTYQDWKLRRAKRKFQVYLKKNRTTGRDPRDGRDDWIH